ncbi:hypothetical protein AURDEDRAFT_186243 [Auricularia subglabra TFB-10046 SS5]|nr:hypothetical protein AURDEDRAFT_186243 [Auricularia subglabra TFB-10046 SS5]
MLHGACYCGEITYTLDDAPGDAMLCHCLTCRTLNSGCSYNFPSRFDRITVTSAKQPTMFRDTKTKSGNAIERYFCGTCGSTLYSRPVGGGAFIKVGALDEAKEMKLTSQVFIEDALPELLRTHLDGEPRTTG